MLLAIDVGNSNTEFGVFAGDQLKASWKCESQTLQSVSIASAEVEQHLTSLQIRPADISQVGISSVIPRLTQLFDTLSTQLMGKQAIVVNPSLNLGIRILYTNPETLGTDRICSAVAGFHKYGGPLIVIDLGTATTFNVIDASGTFLGGSITLGLKSTAEALHSRTAQLPSISLEFPKSVIAKDTQSALQAGVLYSAVAALDGMVTRIRTELGMSTKVVATGGLSALVAQISRTIEVCEPTLVLEGIRLIVERQTTNPTDKHSLSF